MLNDKLLLLALTGEQPIGVIQDTQGLKYMGNVRHIAQWSLLSCPTDVYKKFFYFHYDSFVELTMADSISESILTLYNRDVGAPSNIDFRKAFYNPLFGYKLKSKHNNMQNKKIVKVGCTLSLSGITGPLGREAIAGVEAALHDFNTEKNKVLIQTVVFDDGYVPRRATNNVKKLYDEYGIDIILVPTGTPTLQSYLDMLKSGKIAVLFPYTGGRLFRTPELKNIVNFRASYTQEVQRSIRYIIKTYGIKKIAFFYQDDAYGAPIAQAAREELKKQGITKWLDLPHLRSESDFTQLVKQINDFMPEAIGCFSSHFPTMELINQLGAQYFLDRMLFGVSFLYSDAFKTFLKKHGIQFVFSSVVPDPKMSELPIAKEYMKAIDYVGKFAGVNSFEGYIGASLFIDAIKHVGALATKEQIIRYFEKLRNYQFKGFNLTFDPSSRQLFQKTWILD